MTLHTHRQSWSYGSEMNAAPLLKDFVRLSRDLTTELDRDCDLNGIDQLLLENYMLVVQLAYGHWKQRNVSSGSSDPSLHGCAHDAKLPLAPVTTSASESARLLASPRHPRGN